MMLARIVRYMAFIRSRHYGTYVRMILHTKLNASKYFLLTIHACSNTGMSGGDELSITLLEVCTTMCESVII